MPSTQHTSLGDQVAKKISIWVLVLVLAIIAAIFLMSYFLSRQMFNNQIKTWDKLIPQYTLTSLIDSDSFSIQRDLQFIKSSGLFSSFTILDNQKRLIGNFGNTTGLMPKLISIKDEGGVKWGYYYFEPDFYHFFSPFLIAAVLFFTCVSLFYFIIRARIRSTLEGEFKRFNNFLIEIENVTQKLHEVYKEEVKLFEPQGSYSAEQIIINRAISLLVDEIRRTNISLRDAIAINEQRRFQEELTRTALQVAHDIGSPLAVLEAMLQSTTITLQENDRIAIRNAANRIRDISYSLLKKSKGDLIIQNDVLTQQYILSLIHQVISEKRLQYKSKINVELQLNEDSYGMFAMVRAADFCRVLSNLINNSIEAIEKNNQIILTLSHSDTKVMIEIRDYGKGIPKHILSKLGQLGVTYGKPQGVGMGLHHAISTIEAFGGEVEIESREREGALIKIYLPKAEPPFWFVPKITLMPDHQIVIIDDDENIHAVWKRRFDDFMARYNKSLTLFHFKDPASFIEWAGLYKVEGSILYLCDYEFIGSEMSGIDVITKLKVNYLSILVTSRSIHSDVISKCELTGIKLLPKDMANYISIESQ